MGAKVKPETRFLPETWFLLAITLLATFLRVLRLDFQPLWWDEGYSVWFATHPLGQMAALTAGDIHPPLYYALLHGWILLFGAGPIALRSLSAIFGVMAIPAIYLTGQRLFGRRVALLAALLLALNPFHVFYSQEIRMYGLVALLCTGVLAAAWGVFGSGGAGGQGSRGAEGRRGRGAGARVSPRHRVTVSPCHRVTVSPRHPVTVSPCHPVTVSPCHLVTYVLLTTAALYTQYYAIFLPIGLTLVALWRWRRDVRALARWLAAQAVVALLYLPWVLYAAPKLVLYVSQKVVADADKPLGLLPYLARHLAAFFAGHLEGPLAPWWPAVLILLVPFGGLGIRYFGIRYSGARESGIGSANSVRPIPNPQYPIPAIPNTQYPISPVILLSILLAAALALGWLISLRAPFFPQRGERLLMLALPPFVLLAAAGVDALWRRWRGVGIGALGLIAAVSAASLVAFYAVPRYAGDDYRALIAHTVEQGLPGDTVFAVYPWQVGYWRSVAPAAGPTAVLSPAAAWGPAVAAALDAALAQGRVWFPAHLASGGILETQIEAHLAGRAVSFVNEWHGPNTRLSAWADAGAATNFTKQAPGDGLPIQFTLPGGGPLALWAVSGPAAPIPAANAVTPITLAWQAHAPPPVLAVSVRLTDDLGQIWAQHDYEPLGATDCGLRIADCRLPLEGSAWQAIDRLGLLIPAGTPPGRYHVEMVIRPVGSGRALDATASDGRVLGPAARLFDLAVDPADRVLGPERLPIATRRAIDLGDGLRFLGYSSAAAPLAPGDLRKVSLFWQATGQPTADLVAFVQLLDRQGAVAAGWEAPPGAAYPTTRWAPGIFMRSQAALRAPAALPDGRYRLIAGLYRRADGARLKTADGRDFLSLGTLTIRGRPHAMTPPRPQYPAVATFGSVARLAGYDLAAAEARPGDTLALTLHWQALAATDRPYTVFVHLLDAAGAVRGHGDSEPGGGAFPTPGWLAGEWLADGHSVTLAPAAPPGLYRLAVGFYDPASSQRLTTPNGDDRVVLDAAIRVMAP